MELMRSWFKPVPAYRLATFRVAVALTTILFHVPDVDEVIRTYLDSSFHMPAAFSWVPALSTGAAVFLILLRHLTAWCLLFGWRPRLSALFLFLSDLYIVFLDPQIHFKNNIHFHLTLLALLAFACDRVSLTRLIREDDAEAVCPAWPERLIRIQVAIVFFYTALDKVFSHGWGLSGGRMMDLGLTFHGASLTWLQRLNQKVLEIMPGLLSLATIGTEFFLAAAVLFRRLWGLTTIVMIGFMVYLEFLVRPELFPWDMLAVLFLLQPAGDRAYTVYYNGKCSFCKWKRRWLGRLDWLRRLRYAPLEDSTGGTFYLTGPSGKTEHGYKAFRKLLLLLGGPLYVFFVFIRFEIFGGRWLGLILAYDAIFFAAGALLLFWVPGVSQWVGPPFFRVVVFLQRLIFYRFSPGHSFPIKSNKA